MKFTVALVLLLALAAAANASPLRELMTYGSKRHAPHKSEDDVRYCVNPHDYKGTEPQCPEWYKCAPLDKEVCKVTSKDCKWETTGDCLVYSSYHRKCLSYKRVWKCHEEKKCWDHKCVRDCDPYAMYDECTQKYGSAAYGWSCMKLDRPFCTYKDVCVKERGDCIEYGKEKKCVNEKVCKKVKTDRCKKYDFIDHCTPYDDCRKVPGDKCIEYHKEHVCDQKCVKYAPGGKKCHKVTTCQKWQGSHCVSYYKCEETHRKCIKYEDECYYKDLPTCKKHDEIDHCTTKHRCDKVKAGCIDYYEDDVCHDVPRCHDVRGKCIKYHSYDKCHKVEDHCIKGVCEKKPDPKPKPHYKFSYSIGSG